MTDNEMRIAIAECVGWDACHKRGAKIVGYAPCEPRCVQGAHGPTTSRTEPFVSEPPDFLNDLNAMHEAEEMLHPSQCEHFAFTLQNIVGLFWHNQGKKTINFSQEAWLYATSHATARQRAEAFLRTVGKWKEPQTVETPIATGV